jgi:rsbT co-antagonist protein RsbR
MKSSSVNYLKKKKQLLDSWVKLQLSDESLRDDLLSNEELRVQSDELLSAVVTLLQKENEIDQDSAEYQQINEILSGISISRARQGFTPRETGVFVLSLKAAFIQLLEAELKSDPLKLYEEVSKLGKLMDDLSVITYETYIKGREEVIIRQTDEISEISTPVIRVWDGILALPIIGTLDSARTQVVMENLLVGIVESESRIAILDISGVPAVDSLVAQHLIKTVSATRLMGAECIISGIRPEIAQTIVHLGIDLSGIVTKATLASALRTAFQTLKYDVVKTDKKTK